MIARVPTKEEVRDSILALRRSGYTITEIAQAIGVSKNTVHREVRDLTPTRVVGADGKRRPTKYKKRKPKC